MNPTQQLQALIERPQPLLALAPMQDVTTLAFWRLIARYGGADVYFTEYFRIHTASRLNRRILRAITENPTGRPVVAQMIGNDVPALVRTAKELQHYPIAAVDLNLGCPAPVVYKKCAGGGLLRDPARVDRILGALRDAVRIKFTVKTRVGFESVAEFDAVLPLLARHAVDLLVVHGRTVREMYGPVVHYDLIARAVDAVRCPVLANGNVVSPASAADILRRTGARGLAIGRGAIRNPWLFEQIRQHGRGEPVALPTGRDVLRYVRALHEAVTPASLPETTRVQVLKKYLNFLGAGVPPAEQFLSRMRRARTAAELFDVCAEFLDHDRPMTLEPAI